MTVAVLEWRDRSSFADVIESIRYLVDGLEEHRQLYEALLEESGRREGDPMSGPGAMRLGVG